MAVGVVTWVAVLAGGTFYIRSLSSHSTRSTIVETFRIGIPAGNAISAGISAWTFCIHAFHAEWASRFSRRCLCFSNSAWNTICFSLLRLNLTSSTVCTTRGRFVYRNFSNATQRTVRKTGGFCICSFLTCLAACVRRGTACRSISNITKYTSSHTSRPLVLTTNTVGTRCAFFGVLILSDLAIGTRTFTSRRLILANYAF